MDTPLAPDLVRLIARHEFPRRSPDIERGELAAFNRDVFGRMLDKFQLRAGGFSAASDVEAIHDMRVLARRLAEYLEMLRPAAPTALVLAAQDYLQRFMRILSPIRNADVSRGLISETLRRDLSAVERDALLHLDRVLRKRREKRLRPALELARREESRERLAQLAQLRRGLARAKRDQREVFAGALSAHAGKRAAEALAHLQREGALTTDRDLHGLRIALRRLRYCGEACRKVGGRPSRADVARIRRFSQVLGAQHDFSVLLTRIGKESVKLGKGAAAAHVQKGMKRLGARYSRRRDVFLRAFHRLAGTDEQSPLPEGERVG